YCANYCYGSTYWYFDV
nr:immunoglobulin heavy chain junction region [Mus musculus]